MSSAAGQSRKTPDAMRGGPKSEPLATLVRESIEYYYDELNGQDPADLFALVLAQVERPLLEITMRETRGNMSRAAAFLGLNRATLRKKLEKYGINEAPVRRKKRAASRRPAR
jgi:Fis family transcriptional regulator